MGGAHAKYWEKDMQECKMSVENPEGKSTLSRPICRWEDNLKMYLKGIVREDVEWLFLAQYSNIRLAQYSNIWLAQYSNIWLAQYSNIWLAQYSNIWLALENAVTNLRVP